MSCFLLFSLLSSRWALLSFIAVWFSSRLWNSRLWVQGPSRWVLVLIPLEWVPRVWALLSLVTVPPSIGTTPFLL